MAHLEFCIPVTGRDELVQSTKKRGQYAVRRVLSDPSEIQQKVEECSQLVRSNGAAAIHECFDVFYSVCEHFLKVEKEVRAEVWKTTLAALSAICEEAGDVIDRGDASAKREMRNTLKMWTYLAFQLLEGFENDVSRPGVMEVQEKGKRGKKKASSPPPGGLNWVAEEERVLRLLSCIADLELCQLWDPPSVAIMDSYSNLVASCCYKMLESPSVMKEKAVKEELFQLLGLLVKKYNQTLSMSLKFVQLLQVCEHLAVPLAQALEHFARKFEVKAITAEVVREIGRKDPRDLALDSGGTKTLASFLVELAQRVPDAVYPSISCLLPHLGYESYTMRNGVLGVLGEVLAQVLRPDKMDNEQMKSVRDQCLDQLEEHIHDVNAFVRSRCLQIWQQLAIAKVIPVGRLVDSLLEKTCGRLQDKSSIVRKCAVQFLSVCLQGNPYSSNLDEAEFACKLQEAETELRAVLPGEWQVEVAPPTDGTQEADGNKQPGGEEDEKEAQSPLTALEDQAGHQEGEEETDESAKRVAQLTLVVKYFKHALSFTRLLSQCIPTVSQLLGSKSTTDVMESLEFLCTAQEFGLPHAEEGLRKALALVWSGEGQVRDLLIATYTRLYLSSAEESPRARHQVMCNNLIRLTTNLTAGEHASLEQLVALMVSNKTIPPAVIALLWDTFTQKSPGVTPEQSLGALVILTMVGGAEREHILDKFDVLVSLGLSVKHNSSSFSLHLARQTCLALQKLVVAKKTKGAVSGVPFRLPKEHVLFQRLINMMVEELSDRSHSLWIPFVEEAVATIYTLAEHPDHLATVLLMKLCHVVAPITGEGETDTQRPVEPTLREFDGDFGPESVSTQDPDAQGSLPEASSSTVSGSAVMLGRLLSAVGCVAHHQLLHLEHATLNELKRRARLAEGRSNTSPASTSKTPGGQASTGPKSKPAQGGDEEEEMMGAVADDVELELIHRVCEEELLTPLVSLLGCLVPMVTAICKDPARYNSPMLQSAAALALSKIMLISSKFCDENLQLLVTMMEKSPEPVIRANAIVALGDLTFRFPNLVEPWTPHLYARLVDESVLVRQNTLTVLSHLILNDMVKVKGHISTIALCLEDAEPRIAGLAKLFFHELAKKGNAVYNILPDIISRLSDPQSGVSEELFSSIMKYLMVFIQKERQSESLVEKLCYRFRATRNERQWQDIAQCLAQLPFSERCLRKLQENFACFQDKLGNGRVYASFVSIMNKCKKFAKPEVKATVEELEGKLAEAHKKLTEVDGVPPEHSRPQQAEEKAAGRDKGTATDDGHEAPPDQPVHSPLQQSENIPTSKPPAATTRKSTRRGKSSTKPRQRRVVVEDSEEEEQDYIPKSAQKTQSKSTAKSVRQVTKPSTTRRKKRVNRLTFSSDEEDENDETLNVTQKNIFADSSDAENMDPLCS